MEFDVPVLVLAFNRPEHTRRTLEQIRLARPARLYVHCDGPRANRPGESALVEAVRRVVTETADWPCDVQTLYRPQNVGIRAGIFDAINWFFKNEVYGMIVEDDCLPDPSAFRFCGEMLRKYEDDPHMMHVSCSNWAYQSTIHYQESYVFSQFPIVSGWGTWRRAWEQMTIDLDGMDEFVKSKKINRILTNPMSREYLLDKFWITFRKENTSWAYAWFYSILKNDGYCIFSKLNMVENIGFGEANASHTTKEEKSKMIRAQSLEFPLVHPDKVEVRDNFNQTLFYATQKKRYRLWLWYLLRKLGLR